MLSISFLSSRRSRKFPLLVLVLTIVFSFAIHAQITERYQNRGTYHEGIKSQDVAGEDIKLIGAVVEVGEPLSKWPETLSVRFYNAGSEEVFLKVREWEPEAYYVLDEVEKKSWRGNSVKVFSWPTSIARSIPELKPESLIALVRLGSKDPRRNEKVAPVFLGQGGDPVKANTYRFTLLPNSTAKIQHWIEGPDGKKVAEPTPKRRRVAEVPFDVYWKPDCLPEGTYRLHVKGTFLNDNVNFVQTVEFHHVPSWPL